MGICIHGIAAAAAARREILDITESERSASVLVALELGDGGLGSTNAIEPNDTSSPGATTGLVLDLGLLNLADCCEQLDQILVARGPWKLCKVSRRRQYQD